MDRLCDAVLGARAEYPVKVLQFGEGVFLRAFADELFDDLQQKGLFDGSVAVVQPRPGAGKLDALRAQDGLFTLVTRGLENGESVDRARVIGAVTRCIDPYSEHADYLALIEQPALRFVVSNTTEAGIAYRAEDQLTDEPALGFPAKVAQLLYRRYIKFGADPAKGLIFLPCELIERNGQTLKRIALRHAADWGLGDAFAKWVDEACVFADTLVDRIVSGYPEGEAAALCEKLGYEDALLDVAEPYGLFAIQGAPKLHEELAVDRAALNVVITGDIAPYRTRKVRILNGAHTALTPVALLMGKQTVGESMADPLLRAYLTRLLGEEIIPAMGGDEYGLQMYANEVFERFDNPFLHHRLTGIALNTTSKWRARLLPSAADYVQGTGTAPKWLALALAAAVAVGMSGAFDIRDSDDIETLLCDARALGCDFEGETLRACADIAQHGIARALEMRL